MSRPSLPPFTENTAIRKVRAAEDAWNTRDPSRVVLAYTPDSRWRNRVEFPNGREEIQAFLTRKWARELDYRLIKELWTFAGDRIAVRFAYEYRDDSGHWFRAYGNENWRFGPRPHGRALRQHQRTPHCRGRAAFPLAPGSPPRRPPGPQRPRPLTPSSPAHRRLPPAAERYPAMTKLLFIQASPRGEQSKSIQVAQTYLDALKATNPALEVDVLPLWQTELPAFDGDKAAAKVNVLLGQEQNAVQKTAWDQIVEIASRFIAADRYLFAVAMWNGTIPYRLKHYIDIIHQPSLLWGLKPETGYFGLLENKHATLVLTAGAYADSRPSPAFGVDHQSTYLKAWLNQAGVTAIDEVRFQPTLLTPDPQGALEQAKQAAVDLAKTHARV